MIEANEERDLRDVFLVGPQLRGMIVRGVAVRAADRPGTARLTRRLRPKDRERCFDLMPAEAQHGIRQQAEGCE
jgi:hypothetical protein